MTDSDIPYPHTTHILSLFSIGDYDIDIDAPTPFIVCALLLYKQNRCDVTGMDVERKMKELNLLNANGTLLVTKWQQLSNQQQINW